MPQVVLAADLGGTKLSAAAVNRQGKILARKTEPVDLSSTLAPVEQICRLAAAVAHRFGRTTPFAAAGVAIPGLVRRTGTVWAPNLPGWKSVPLARLLEGRLRVPVVVESDRNAGVTGEAWRGAFGLGCSPLVQATCTEDAEKPHTPVSFVPGESLF